MATTMKAFKGCKAGNRRAAVVARAEVDRRAALAGFAAVPAVLAAKPAEAAYGEGANVFGRATNTTGFVPYTGDGFAVLLPSKYNPSKEIDFKGVVLRYEDNGDAVNNLVVIKLPSQKSSIEQYGSPEQFLGELQNIGLFGKQAYTGSSRSEGGFVDGRYAAASLLGVDTIKDKKGRQYYTYDVLVRSADGDEGGRHQIIKAAVGSDGKLYISKFQVGDKRWFKGAKNEALGSTESFIVAQIVDLIQIASVWGCWGATSHKRAATAGRPGPFASIARRAS
eukprot:TRINITY_DN2664_c0_g1_i1.p1 TRINITY_DN2664_c0_g1~~TRINITY_DN2664_c0_g1_i1.p1  ORF type:complete len:280 (-),score=48.67 TRINITY_DN2664_c0_g1_i1:361-1200(-)